MPRRFHGIFLLAAVFVIATCGLVYELIAATLSSYLLGGSVTHFSIVIGVFLTAMGLGSYLTRFIENNLTDAFLGVQIGIGLSGGLSAAILLLTFSVLQTYLPVLVTVTDRDRNVGRHGDSHPHKDSSHSGSPEADRFQCVGPGLCGCSDRILCVSIGSGALSGSVADVFPLSVCSI